jgi:phosphoribosylformylglycinamidine synthase I
MKFGVVVFPGSNCDEDMVNTLGTVMGQKVEKLWHKETDLKGCDFIVLPGGFSYGDYLRSGAIARFSPIMDEVVKHANKGGYLLGICNGFQVLAEANLVPGALLHNNNQKFICDNVFLKSTSKTCLINQGVPANEALKIPIAHGEGRYFAQADTLKEINDNDQVIFRYCDAGGNIVDSANPNGSLENIAGVSNKNKNVFGMMPHPERAANNILSNVDGRYILDALLSEVTV